MIRQESALANSAIDITRILNAIVDASTLSGDDYIERTVGHLRCIYYVFVDEYHVRPKDLIDLIDGVLYIECKNYIQKREMERLQAQQRNNNGQGTYR